MQRRGWMAHSIKNAETTADHIFRTTVLAWVLNKKKGNNQERVLKTALIHDLCEVFGGDETPYDPLLPEKLNFLTAKKARKILEKWPKFTQQQKKDKFNRKHKKELEGLRQLIKKLPPSLRQETMRLWENFELGKSKEGRFVKQADKIENFLQGTEYWKEQGKIKHQLWDRWAKEILDDKIILEFKGAIDRKFLKDKKRGNELEGFMDQALEFLLKIGRLKRVKQEKWKIRGIKNSETVAQHIFRVTIMAWFLAEKKGNLDIDKIIKIALVHDFCDMEGCHESLCDVAAKKSNNFLIWQKRKKLNQFPRLPKGERLRWYLDNNKKERECIKKLAKHLPKGLREEIVSLWIEFTEGLTKEGRFVKQVAKIESLLQAMEYARENRKFPIALWWVEIREIVDDPVLVQFLKELDKSFDYNRKKIA